MIPGSELLPAIDDANFSAQAAIQHAKYRDALPFVSQESFLLIFALGALYEANRVLQMKGALPDPFEEVKGG